MYKDGTRLLCNQKKKPKKQCAIISCMQGPATSSGATAGAASASTSTPITRAGVKHTRAGSPCRGIARGAASIQIGAPGGRLGRFFSDFSKSAIFAGFWLVANVIFFTFLHFAKICKNFLQKLAIQKWSINRPFFLDYF